VDHRETYRTTLQYAVAIAGSEFALAIRLRVPLGLLQNWLNGVSEAPASAFLGAVDVIVAASPSDIARCRDSMRKFTGKELP
jgi:DNA-binding transcriptional regulator YdaS (Cro superfamily)